MSRRDEKLIWFATGAVIGAAVALLVAPTSGEELRGRIGESAGEGKDRLVRNTRELVGKGKDLYEKGKQIADDAAGMFAEGREMLNMPTQNDNV